MSIWKMCQDYLKERRQKGQIIVFTAVLLPFIIAMCGLTVDFGNMYVHKSKLQNAADAAAIAGAYAYAENNKDENKAYTAAKKSIDANLPNTTLASGKCKPIPGDEGKIYYGVKISENVPIYFLRLFNVGNTAEVAADAYASIETTSGGGGSIFDNLFTFSKDDNPYWQGPGFEATQANEAGLNEPITKSSIFEGNIKFIGEKSDLKTEYRHQLLNKAALDAYNNGTIKTVGDAINDKQYYTVPECDTSTTLDSELATIKSKATNADTGAAISWTNGKNLSTLYSEANGKDYVYNNCLRPDNQEGNASLTIDTNLPTGSDPFFVVLDPKWSNVYLNIYNSTEDKSSRPIVFVYTGTNDINIEANNSFFHGIIYAPNARIHMNTYNMNFYGSIAAKTIALKQKAYFEIDKNLSKYFGGSGSSGSGSGSGSTSIGLVSPPSDINWND